MSLQLQGKILSFSFRDHAISVGVEISPRAISTTKLLLVTLANFKNDITNQCNPSIKTLARHIEKSESQTTEHMNYLKKLGLVEVSRNAKGGRFTPQYEIRLPSSPVDKSVNQPVKQTPMTEISYPYQPIETIQLSGLQDRTPIADQPRTLIDPLDKTLINSLCKEKNAALKKEHIYNLGRKYEYPIQNNTPMTEVLDWLTKISNCNESIRELHK